MSSAKAGAVYLDSDSSSYSQRSRKSSAVFLAALLAFVTLVLTVIPLTQAAKPLEAEAGPVPVFCQSDLGWWMEQNPWTSALDTYPADKMFGRTLTAQEAFGNSMVFTAYQGEGEGDFLTRETPKDRLKVKGTEAQKRVTDLRSSSTCALGALGAGAGNALLLSASAISSVASAFAGFAFSTNIVCEEPGQGGACFDLLKIIGGTGDQSGGIIGALTSSIYTPLLILVAVAAGVWVAWTGIVQRKLREALWGAIWVLFSVIIGLAFLLKPALLAKIPMTAGNTLASCVIGAFGGNNCFSGEREPQQLTSSDVCATNATRAPVDEQMGLIIEGLTCGVWKAFVLEPYSQGNFGQSFEQLDTSNPGNVLNKALEASGEKPSSFCVALALPADKNVAGSRGGTLETTGTKICNLALYQMYLQNNASSDGGKPDPAIMEKYGIDSRWTKVVNVTANSDTFWSYWPASNSGAMNKVMVGGLAALASFLGGIVIIVIAVFAVMYYVSAIFMTAFAPLFFLLGVHPGKGRDLLKGYAEVVLSNILKYIASALFLVVTIAIYGGVLGASSSMGTTLLFVLIMSLALLLYRRELVELIGRVDMGGKQLSNKLSDTISDGAKSTARFGAVALGSATGASLAGGSFAGGLGDGALRELKGGRVPILGQMPGGEIIKQGVAGAARGADAASNKNERDLREQANEAKDKTREHISEEKVANAEFEESVSEYTLASDSLTSLAAQIDDLTQRVENSGQDAILDRMADMSPAGAQYAEAARLGGAISVIDNQILDGQAQGADVSDLVQQRQELSDRRLSLASSLRDSGELDGLRTYYNSEIARHNEDVGELQAMVKDYNVQSAHTENLAGKVEAARDRVISSAGNAAASREEELAATTAIKGVSQSTWVTGATVDKVQRVVDAVGEPARADAEAAAAEGLAPGMERVQQVDRRAFATPDAAPQVQSEGVEEALPGLTDLTGGSNSIPTAEPRTEQVIQPMLDGTGAATGGGLAEAVAPAAGSGLADAVAPVVGAAMGLPPAPGLPTAPPKRESRSKIVNEETANEQAPLPTVTEKPAEKPREQVAPKPQEAVAKPQEQVAPSKPQETVTPSKPQEPEAPKRRTRVRPESLVPPRQNDAEATISKPAREQKPERVDPPARPADNEDPNQDSLF